MEREVLTERMAEGALHMPDGVELPLRVWTPWDRPAEGVILALHGFNDYSKGLASPGKGMARRGLRHTLLQRTGRALRQGARPTYPGRQRGQLRCCKQH